MCKSHTAAVFGLKRLFDGLQIYFCIYDITQNLTCLSIVKCFLHSVSNEAKSSPAQFVVKKKPPNGAVVICVILTALKTHYFSTY